MIASMVLATSITTARFKDEAQLMSTRIPSSLDRQGEILQGWAKGRLYATSGETKLRVISATSKNAVIDINRAEPTQTDKALGRLRAFKQWGANWDGEGAPQPDLGTINSAITLLSLLAQQPQTFGVDLDANGKPMFHLRDSAYEGFILVEDSHTLSFSFRKGADFIDDYEIEFDGRTLPETLAEALQTV